MLILFSDTVENIKVSVSAEFCSEASAPSFGFLSSAAESEDIHLFACFLAQRMSGVLGQARKAVFQSQSGALEESLKTKTTINENGNG